MLLAVHLADGAVTPAVWVAGWVVAAVFVAACARRIPDAAVPRVGLVTAALFVASQLHLRVGPASVHLLLNGLAGVLLGRTAVAAVAASLALQLLLFAHGGLSTFGLNVTIYALPALAASLWKPQSLLSGAAVGGLTAVASVALNAGCLLFGGSEGVDQRVVGLVVLCHLPVVAVEAAVTGFAVVAVRQAQAGNTSGNGVSH